MRAAIGLADIGLAVVLVEKEELLGGWVGRLGPMFPHGRKGTDLVATLQEQLGRRPLIAVLTRAEVVGKSGTYGNYRVVVEASGEQVELDVGQIVVATGFANYEPPVGNYGYGTPGVVTLPELDQMLDRSDGPLVHDGKPVGSVSYIYCVGSRDAEHPYCSKFCCSAAVHASLRVAEHNPGARQYHLYRDMRTYGRNEEMLSESRGRGSVYMKFADDCPPTVEGANGRLAVKVRDLLTAGEELTVPVDLVVLVTGMAPRENGDLVGVLKVPVGQDGFFNEIHPKLRPVETVVDGVTICGTCQGPKTSAESVASGLAAVTQVAAVLKRGVAELDPQVATVTATACNACGACVGACPFAAISLVEGDGTKVARIDAAGCKGCGACVPVCPTDAIDLAGYTDSQIRGVIDALLSEVAR